MFSNIKSPCFTYSSAENLLRKYLNCSRPLEEAFPKCFIASFEVSCEVGEEVRVWGPHGFPS